jgi:hypothetical protein
MGQIIINNSNYVGKSVTISGNKVIIDGKDVTPDSKDIKIVVNGDIESLNADYIDSIEVHGNVGSIKSGSGDISCKDIGGDVKTGSGDVEANVINGGVQTGSGSVRSEIIRGEVKT